MKGMLFKPWKIQFIAEHPDIEIQTRRLGGLKGINEYPDQWELMPGHDANSLIWLFHNTEISEIASTKPRYCAGETAYIKEAWYVEKRFDHLKPKDIPLLSLVGYPSRDIKPDWAGKLRSPMFLRQEFARIFITITDVRVERLQEITEGDAIAEGVNPYLITKLEGGKHYRMIKTYHHENYPLVSHADEGEEIVFECPNMGFARCHHLNWKDGESSVFRIDASEAFNYIGSLHPDYINGSRNLWNSINPKYPWELNPWVFKYSFKKAEL